jgi:uncharacterized protein
VEKTPSARYLFRLANTKGNSPSDVHRVSELIRNILGSRESASHFRISTRALEFNVFAKNEEELDEKRRRLHEKGFDILSTKLLDTPPVPMGRLEALKEGVELFNEERFWESHEVLEQIWRESRGAKRDAVQSLILTAAAFVHFQKNEPDIFLSVLKRARAKAGDGSGVELLDLDELRENLDTILASGNIRLFKLKIMDC